MKPTALKCSLNASKTLQLEITASTSHSIEATDVKTFKKVFLFQGKKFSGNLLKVRLHVQSYLSASFAVDESAPAVAFSAANLLEYISNDISVGSVPVFDMYFDPEEKVA